MELGNGLGFEDWVLGVGFWVLDIWGIRVWRSQAFLNPCTILRKAGGNSRHSKICDDCYKEGLVKLVEVGSCNQTFQK